MLHVIWWVGCDRFSPEIPLPYLPDFSLLTACMPWCFSLDELNWSVLIVQRLSCRVFSSPHHPISSHLCLLVLVFANLPLLSLVTPKPVNLNLGCLCTLKIYLSVSTGLGIICMRISFFIELVRLAFQGNYSDLWLTPNEVCNMPSPK